PPITTTVCPRSSGSRWIGEGTVLIVPPIRIVYFFATLLRVSSERSMTSSNPSAFACSAFFVIRGARCGVLRDQSTSQLCYPVPDRSSDCRRQNSYASLKTRQTEGHLRHRIGNRNPS